MRISQPPDRDDFSELIGIERSQTREGKRAAMLLTRLYSPDTSASSCSVRLDSTQNVSLANGASVGAIVVAWHKENWTFEISLQGRRNTEGEHEGNRFVLSYDGDIVDAYAYACRNSPDETDFIGGTIGIDEAALDHVLSIWDVGAAQSRKRMQEFERMFPRQLGDAGLGMSDATDSDES